MISFPGTTRIWLYRGVTDMRKSFHGLCGMVRAHFDVDVLSGEVVCFLNRRRNYLKAIWWDRDGFAIFAKRLERGTFRVPPADCDQMELSRAQLSMLLEGITPLRLSRRYQHPEKTPETQPRARAGPEEKPLVLRPRSPYNSKRQRDTGHDGRT